MVIRIASKADVRSAVGLIPATVQHWQGEEGPRAFASFSPGSIQIRRFDPNRFEKWLGARASNLGINLDLTDTATINGLMNKKTRITEFSAKSRANMVKRLTTLDYSPLFKDDRKPALVTLTLPGEWLEVAPDAETFKRLLFKLRDRFRYQWGCELLCVWKMEFQRRGAPHYHLLMTPPAGRSKGAGLSFIEWLSLTWADLCKYPGQSEEEYLKHYRAGTGIDASRGLDDPKRAAVYFSKHGQFFEKEYQNQPPEEWKDQGKTPGRFWGYWGLQRADYEIPIANDAPPEKRLTLVGGGRTFVYRPEQQHVINRLIKYLSDDRGSVRLLPRIEEDGSEALYIMSGRVLSDSVYNYWLAQLAAVECRPMKSLDVVISRFVHQLAKSESFTAKSTVYRNHVDLERGTIKTYRRKVTRRKKFYRGGSGFYVRNDGLNTIKSVQRIVESWLDSTGYERKAYTQHTDLRRAHQQASQLYRSSMAEEAPSVRTPILVA